ncbi:MAG TPA: maleylpyruvate isomerase N-terminal domain-containing protein [Acidimicrobiales bacterium]|nr:maleylpyruvate isomerase N-terminal domain-containing protein [Acidimicrobiales bacterium]
MSGRLSFEEYLSFISADADRLSAVTAVALGNRVPACPDWTARDLVEHVGGVYEFFRLQVEAADVDEAHEIDQVLVPEATDPGEWLEQQATDLLATMESAGAEAPCWNWSGADCNVAWVARRMALETAVHRYDGEMAAGDPRPLDVALSVDGIDERIYVHLATDVPDVRTAALGGSICLVCTDAEAAWVVEVGGGSMRARDKQGPASACLRGTASDLFLFSWNRLAPSALDLTGDPAVARAWASLPV